MMGEENMFVFEDCFIKCYENEKRTTDFMTIATSTKKKEKYL